MTDKQKVKDGMEITKEIAIKENKKLAKLRKKTIEEKDKEFADNIKKAMANPSFLVDVLKEIQKEVAGEEDTIIAQIIVATTRLVKGAIPESKNLFLSDTTGIGKDYVTKKTLEVILPEEEHLHVTKMSKEVFTYWHAFEEGWTWDNKVIHFEDITQELLNSSTFKVMSSGGSHAVVVKDQKTVEIPIVGKPCMILTSHHTNPQSEALRRFPIGALNETKEQTVEIHDKISKRYSGREEHNIDYIIKSAVQSLEPYEVIIPYAELIQHFFPKDIFMRTHYQRFLNYICSSAVLHQYQRDKTEDKKLIATPDDYMIARLVLLYTTSNPKMIPMSKEYRDLIKLLEEKVEPMTVKEIYVKYDKSMDWLYKNLPKIIETKLIITDKKQVKDSVKDVFTYQYIPGKNPYSIPTWNEIGNQILKVTNKTKKTNKTPLESLLERWFYYNKIKPIKQGDTISVVLFGHNNTFNRLELLVFANLLSYLCQKDEKRYSHYYKERDLPLYNKIQKLKNSINESKIGGFKINDEFLTNNFESNLITQLIESGQLIKQPNGEYVFGGIY